METLFLDVLGNKRFVEGYQIDDSIVQKWFLKPGDVSPFTGLRVETLSPKMAEKLKEREAERLERLKKSKKQKKEEPKKKHGKSR
jgi:hypothetical protein